MRSGAALLAYAERSELLGTNRVAATRLSPVSGATC